MERRSEYSESSHNDSSYDYSVGSSYDERLDVMKENILKLTEKYGEGSKYVELIKESDSPTELVKNINKTFQANDADHKLIVESLESIKNVLDEMNDRFTTLYDRSRGSEGGKKSKKRRLNRKSKKNKSLK
jgi:phage shock protein A